MLRVAIDQSRSAAEAAHLAPLARDIFMTLTAARIERGDTLSALNGDAPSGARPWTDDNRLKSEINFRAALTMLAAIDQPWAMDITTRLSLARDAVQALRVPTDAERAKVKSLRDPKAMQNWGTTTGKYVDLLVSVAGQVETALQQANPRLDYLVALKQAATLTRTALGDAIMRIAFVLSSGREWKPSDAAAQSSDEIKIASYWSFVEKIAVNPRAPVELQAKVKAATDKLQGDLLKQRRELLLALTNNEKPGLKADDYLARQIAGSDSIDDAMTSALDTAVITVDGESRAATHDLILAGVVMLWTLIISLSGLYVLFYRVGRPISRITQTMTKLAGGDLDADIPYEGRGDEIGSMSSALCHFKESMIRERASAVAEQKASEARNQRTVVMTQLVQSFEAKIAEMSSIVSSSSTELEATARSMLNQAQRSMERTASLVHSTDLARCAIQHTAESAEHLSASIVEVTRQVNEQATVTERSAQQARVTDATIQRLSEGASKIGEVVDQIGVIAKQTNLLALNATIEAARSGDAGKGFAVVASEVRNLARQTADATQNIYGQIAGVQMAVAQVVNEIGSIISGVEDGNRIASMIALAVEKQRNATQEIAAQVRLTAANVTDVAKDILEVKDAVDMTDSAAAEVLGAARELSEQAEGLNHAVDVFSEGVKEAA